MRPSKRTNDEMRAIKFTRHFTEHAEGSVLVEFGRTRVLCNASVESGVPRFLKGEGKGWITAEYAMLPRSTHSRLQRESHKGKVAGRTHEIQRLIGRSLRSVVQLKALGETTITLDCDVLQADGGTRTAAISGAYVALADALAFMKANKMLRGDEAPMLKHVAAVSVGLYQGEAVLDLDYDEDSRAETDMNIVMDSQGNYIELQGTAESKNFADDQLQQMLSLGKKGITEIIAAQKAALTS